MKKILIWIVLMILLVVVSIVGTLAYLTAVDEEKNVLALGEARIELREYERTQIESKNNDDIKEFVDNKLLIPSVVSDGFTYPAPAYNTTPTDNYVVWNEDHEDKAIIVGGNTDYTSPIWKTDDITNEIDKMVFVKNTGNCNVYVRLCFAFEAGNYVRLDRFKEMVHLNLNTTDWAWEWVEPEKDHISVIDDTRCFLAWATYKHVLPVGEHTKISLSQIALDFSAINDHVRAFGEKYEVEAFAQGIQAEGFESANAALAKGFGDTIPFKNVKFVEFTDLKTALHYLDGVVSEANKITSKVTNVIFGLTEKYKDEVAGRKGVLVANLENQADFTAYAYYVPNGENYDIYVLADDWKIYAPANSTDLFSSMTALTKVDTSMLDVSNVTTALRMFSSCTQLVELDTSDWKFPKLKTMQLMFAGSPLLEELDVSGWGITNALTNIEQAFDGCNALKTLDCSGWDVSNVATMRWAFRNCKQLTELDVSGWDVGNVKLFWDMFKSCSALKTIPVDTWTWGDSNHVAEEMKSVFSGCSSLTSLDLSKWEVGNVTSTQDMFSGCSSLTSINFSGWNTEKVVSMANMFYKCHALTDINISNWNVSSLANTQAMFQNCFALETIDLSGWTLRESGDVSMIAMFKMESIEGATTLTTIYVGDGWNIDKLSESANMFNGCGELVGGKGTTLALTKVESGNVMDKTYARVDGGIVYDKNGNKDTTNAGYLTYKKA